MSPDSEEAAYLWIKRRVVRRKTWDSQTVAQQVAGIRKLLAEYNQQNNADQDWLSWPH